MFPIPYVASVKGVTVETLREDELNKLPVTVKSPDMVPPAKAR